MGAIEGTGLPSLSRRSGPGLVPNLHATSSQLYAAIPPWLCQPSHPPLGVCSTFARAGFLPSGEQGPSAGALPPAFPERTLRGPAGAVATARSPSPRAPPRPVLPGHHYLGSPEGTFCCGSQVFPHPQYYSLNVSEERCCRELKPVHSALFPVKCDVCSLDCTFFTSWFKAQIPVIPISWGRFYYREQPSLLSALPYKTLLCRVNLKDVSATLCTGPKLF